MKPRFSTGWTTWPGTATTPTDITHNLGVDFTTFNLPLIRIFRAGASVTNNPPVLGTDLICEIPVGMINGASAAHYGAFVLYITANVISVRFIWA